MPTPEPLRSRTRPNLTEPVPNPKGAKHTPGPWAYDAVMSDHLHDIILGYQNPEWGHPVVLASCHGDEEEDGGHGTISNHEAQANARLMAAAPELLETLESVAEFLDRFGFLFNPAFAQEHHEISYGKIQSVIKKAKGD